MQLPYNEVLAQIRHLTLTYGAEWIVKLSLSIDKVVLKMRLKLLEQAAEDDFL